jgi:hypothetical protein
MLGDEDVIEVPAYESVMPISNPNFAVGNLDVGGTFLDVEGE